MTLLDEIHVTATEGFIAANPTDLVGYRVAESDDGHGGTTRGAATAVWALCGRLVGARLTDPNSKRSDADGNQIAPRWTLVCHPEEDVQIGDYFDHNSERYTVTQVSTSPPWRKTAALVVTK